MQNFFDIIYAFIYNVFTNSHVMRTKIPLGKCGELGNKLEDALMLGLIDFVDNICSQYVSSGNGIDYLQRHIELFEITNRNDPMNKIIDAYYFAKYRYMTFNSSKESGYSDIPPVLVGSLVWGNPDISAAIDRMEIIEEEFDKEMTKHLTNIVKYRHLLWT